MQFQMLLESIHAQHSLQRALAHLMDVRKPHVIRDQGDYLVDVGIRESQPVQDFARDSLAQLHMSIESDALGHAKCPRLADIVQQNPEGQRGRRSPAALPA